MGKPSKIPARKTRTQSKAVARKASAARAMQLAAPAGRGLASVGSASEPMEQAPSFVAFMRGINVGGKNKLLMADLVAIFEKAGCTNVRTYIQSGNVVFSISSDALEGLAGAVMKGIESRFKIRTPVVIREASDLERVAVENPFLREVQDTGSLHVGFLADDPEPSRVARLDPNRSPGDRFKWLGREIYLHLPNGMARSKLTNAYFDSALATISTFRNWRTVLTMLEMTRGKS